ncbi:MAG: hypothetical protein HY072_05355 [Deltaproteobacteria bacterium]|nr:hypothetical protein [Deltaproteobacteria bacterium]
MKQFLVCQICLTLLFTVSCATKKIEAPLALPEPPQYTKVPHPEGLDLADLKAIFYDKQAPALNIIDNCDANYKKLTTATQSKEEIQKGVQELVSLDPASYHWCFYGKLLGLENQLKTQSYIEEKQKLVVETFAFLTPVAKAYYIWFHDSRYMRWAIDRYKKLSEFVFYRRLELGKNPYFDATDLAVGSFSRFREPASEQPKLGVLEKYGILKPLAIPTD